MSLLPESENRREEAEQFAAGLRETLGTASDFYENTLLPTVRKKGSDMAPTRLSELISKYEEVHPGKKVDSLALINVAIASIARSELEIILPNEDPSIERRWQAGRIIQKAFEISEEIFQKMISGFQEDMTQPPPSL